MHPLAKGDSYKTLRVNAKSGMEMPAHHATSEAIIVVEKGKAILTMNGESHTLQVGSSIILPAKVDHSLKIEKDFQAVVVLDAQAEIEFN